MLATTLSRWESAERHFEHALAMNVGMDMRPYIAYTQYAWADMFVRRAATGDVQRARELNAQALAATREMGMVRLERMAAALALRLPSAGTQPALDRDLSHYGLSARELDVLRLLVHGHSDRDIAEALFISHRTVTTHVTNILNKLGVESRTAAATVAVRQGIA